MKEQRIGLSAHHMSEATEEEWQRFIALLGADAALRLREAMRGFTSLLDRQAEILGNGGEAGS